MNVFPNRSRNAVLVSERCVFELYDWTSPPHCSVNSGRPRNGFVKRHECGGFHGNSFNSVFHKNQHVSNLSIPFCTKRDQSQLYSLGETLDNTFRTRRAQKRAPHGAICSGRRSNRPMKFTQISTLFVHCAWRLGDHACPAQWNSVT